MNIAYEAATADLDDANIIDPFHLEAYGKTTVNYNRDVEAFPVVRALMEKISGQSPYQIAHRHGRQHGGLRHHRRRCLPRGLQDGDRAPLLPGLPWPSSAPVWAPSRSERLEIIMKKAGVDKNFSPAS